MVPRQTKSRLSEPGGHRPVLAEPSDRALDGVALLIDGRVEGGRAAAFAASPAPVGGLAGGLRNGGFDAA